MDNSEYNVWKWLGAEKLKPKTSQEQRLNKAMENLQQKLTFAKLDSINALQDKL